MYTCKCKYFSLYSRLRPLPADLLDPPLAELYKLDGIQPRNQSDLLWLAAARKLEKKIVKCASVVNQNWAFVAMEMLKSVVGSVEDDIGTGVRVQAELKPGECVVLYCRHGDNEVRDRCSRMFRKDKELGCFSF